VEKSRSRSSALSLARAPVRVTRTRGPSSPHWLTRRRERKRDPPRTIKSRPASPARPLCLSASLPLCLARRLSTSRALPLPRPRPRPRPPPLSLPLSPPLARPRAPTPRRRGTALSTGQLRAFLSREARARLVSSTRRARDGDRVLPGDGRPDTTRHDAARPDPTRPNPTRRFSIPASKGRSA
jgi:hypothetical protein